jgi:2-polyprenyl-3-methyl-5-hydroxy-6-metoxy-1,4-benzoquinol methylase
MKEHITASWEKNAAEWIRVIDNEEIASRKFTNKAILQILAETPSDKVLDVGCGEGWLTRSLSAMGKTAVGIDAIRALLENARSKGSESYYELSFEAIMAGQPIPEARFDIAVFNFCLYKKDGLAILLANTKKAINKDGFIIIQTLHPYFLIKNGYPYKSRSMENSWEGLPGNFKDGHSWYARTLEGWISEISESGMQLAELREISNAENLPVSLILKIR